MSVTFINISQKFSPLTRKKYLYDKNILLNDSSNDKSTVLSNLYKIATTRRANGLSNKIVLDETIRELANPFSIEQKFGTFSRKEVNQLLKNKDSLYVKTQSENPINNNTRNHTTAYLVL